MLVAITQLWKRHEGADIKSLVPQLSLMYLHGVPLPKGIELINQTTGLNLAELNCPDVYYAELDTEDIIEQCFKFQFTDTPAYRNLCKSVYTTEYTKKLIFAKFRTGPILHNNGYLDNTVQAMWDLWYRNYCNTHSYQHLLETQ